MKKISSQDRSRLIRLASSLPKGSEERKAILAGLQKRAKSLPGFRGLFWESSRDYDDDVGPLSKMPSKYRSILGSSWLVAVAPEGKDETDLIVLLKKNGFSRSDKVRAGENTFEMWENDAGLVAILDHNDYGAELSISLENASQLSGKMASGDWVRASRFPMMLALTSRSGELGVDSAREVPKAEWAKAERDLSRMPKYKHGPDGLPFGAAQLYDIVDMLETGEDPRDEFPDFPASVMRAVDALYG